MSNPTEKSDYMLLFRGTGWDKGLPDEKLQEVMESVMKWMESLDQKGVVKGGKPLGFEAKTVTGKSRTISDGPFAESKEAVGGYLVVETATLDEAACIAQQCPLLSHGVAIEVRPVLEECPTFQRVKARLGPFSVLASKN